MSTLWFCVVGALLAVYSGLAGIDYGVGMTLPFRRDEAARRAALNAIGPMFLGNEVWIIGAVGVLLAAFPSVETTLFRTAYPAVVAFVLGLVAVNAGVQLRSRGVRRGPFDVLIAAGSLVTPVAFGLLLGNLLIGLPPHLSGLLRPVPLLVGLSTGALALAHGAAFLRWRVGSSTGRLSWVAAGVVAVAILVSGLAAPAVQRGNAFAGLTLALVLLAALVVAASARRAGVAFAASLVATALPPVAVGVLRHGDLAAGASQETMRLLLVTALPVLPVLVAVQALGWWYFRRGARVTYW